MVNIDTSTVVFAWVFLAIAAIAAVVSVAALGQLVVTNRRERLAQHQSIRQYYRAALSH